MQAPVPVLVDLVPDDVPLRFQGQKRQLYLDALERFGDSGQMRLYKIFAK